MQNEGKMLTIISEDKADHADVARSLATATGCAVAVPNYRLTPKSQGEFRHPGHAQDILRMLEFILHWTPHANARVSRQLMLIGHSCSAHMLSSIFLDSGEATLKPTDELLKAVKGIVMSEGIYDLDNLLAAFPKYREWFIEPAFGPATSYQAFSTLGYPPWPASAITWLVLHSKGDSLIDLQQSEKMYQHLLNIQPYDVDADFASLIEEHDDVLRGTEYVKVIKDFARRTIGIQI